jgi:hypothetical protein
MGSDRARVTYDRTRMWRSVIAQQGRVSLEADWNESIDIQAAAARELTLDVIGPEGRPDNGYTVSSVSGNSKGNASKQDLSISEGVLYLGGERLSLPAAIKYSSQPDWLDSATDPSYTAYSAIPTSTTEELVYLTATEQEVSAVEDPALSDVAIGGPDTAQRLRILQRVRRFPTTADTCSDAFIQLQTTWSKQGYSFDPTTMRLASSATLLVGYTTPLTQGTPCQPTATGGYLGAENQMYRVEIVALDAKGNPIIAWGPDDASFIYRVTASRQSDGTTTLTLASAPVDSYHNPQDGQAVQLLASAVQLAAATDEDIASYVASPTGIVTTLNNDYQPGSQQITLNAPTTGPIPAAYFDTSATPQLFVRIWQGSGTASSGKAFALTDTQNHIDTGLTVTLASKSGFHVGDFWRFALRPIEPAQIYPARYMNGAQPPDGPQTWAGPLAVINWSGSTPQITSCIPSFPNLTEDTGCECSVCLTPSSSTTLQDAVNQLQKTGGTICLSAGEYQISNPVALANCRNLRIRGQGKDTILQAPNGAFTLTNCTSCTIEDLAIVSQSGGDSTATAVITLAATLGTTLQRMAVLALGSRGENTAGFAAVALDGIQAELTIRENLIIGSVGIATPTPSKTPGGLLAIAMRIESNTLLCSQSGIVLQGKPSTDASPFYYAVAFAFSSEFNDNYVITPGTPGNGITALGVMLCGGLLRIDGNDVLASGVGITTSPSNCLVTGNTVSGPAEQASTGTGIELVNEPVFDQAAPAAIENNTVTAMATGIAAGSLPIRATTTGDVNVASGFNLSEANLAAKLSNTMLTIAQNTIQNCNNGMSAIVAAGDIAIRENRLLSLAAPSSDAKPFLWGILLYGGSSSSIVGNIIDGISVNNGTAAGVIIEYCDTIVVSDNAISNPTTKGDAANVFGIAIVETFSSADISRNQIQLSRATQSIAVSVVGDSATAANTAALASVTNNMLSSSGASANAVSVTDVRDIQFSGNNVTATNTGQPAVTLKTTTVSGGTVRCCENMVRAAAPTKNTTAVASIALTLYVNGNPRYAVLGNITSYEITVNTSALGNPWLPLNVVG